MNRKEIVSLYAHAYTETMAACLSGNNPWTHEEIMRIAHSYSQGLVEAAIAYEQALIVADRAE